MIIPYLRIFFSPLKLKNAWTTTTTTKSHLRWLEDVHIPAATWQWVANYRVKALWQNPNNSSTVREMWEIAAFWSILWSGMYNYTQKLLSERIATQPWKACSPARVAEFCFVFGCFFFFLSFCQLTMNNSYGSDQLLQEKPGNSSVGVKICLVFDELATGSKFKKREKDRKKDKTELV